ncbi:aquaporin-like [Raphidocelis subcapitata]|uniref:Aquaporin-like n=1 Tax=Raphidocelis subcapitata TaxID=307507 RepID=A0A2V0P018_9CHLO|nr:aquaporin-like [Raphidocelis subcapitata]|eukprot:GBF93218.1 aquaporin-like [Raphidocelis subcapitata]
MAPSTMERRAAARRKKARDDSWWQLLLAGDFSMSCIFVALMSLTAEAAEALSGITGIGELPLSIGITVAALLAFGPVCALWGGALFNPVHNIAFIAAGKDTARLNVARMAAQVAGALLGASLAVTMLPEFLKDHFHKIPGGLVEGVPLPVGMACEALLGCVLNLVVLLAMETSNKLVAKVLPICVTIGLVFIGSGYSGPGLNPIMLLSFFIHYSEGKSPFDHFLLYWVAPFAGAFLGGLIWRLTHGPGVGQAKKPAKRRTE